MNVFSRGVRNAYRNGMRALSIVVILGLSIGLALSMLIAHQAVSNSINSVKSSIGNTVTISPAGFSGFSQVNNSLTATQLSKVSSLPHIIGLSESIADRLTTIGTSAPTFGFGGEQSNGTNTTSLTSPVKLNFNRGSRRGLFIAGGGGLPSNFSLPVSVLGTNNPLSVNGTAITVYTGHPIDGTKDTDSALVSSGMATKNNLKVGSTFTAYNSTIAVAGIFKSSNRAAEGTIIMPLPAVQRLSGQPGDVTNAVATVDTLDNLTTATNEIKNTLGSSADVVSSVEQANQAVQPLDSVKSISLYSLIGALVAGAIIILMTMVMIVRERTREIGIIKAIGGSNARIALQFMAESVTLTLSGAVLGVVLAALAANPITKMLVSNTTSSPAGRGGGLFHGGGARFVTGGRGLGVFGNGFANIHAAAGWDLLIYGFLAAIIISIFGSGIASYFISKIRPAEVMRTE